MYCWNISCQFAGDKCCHSESVMICVMIFCFGKLCCFKVQLKVGIIFLVCYFVSYFIDMTYIQNSTILLNITVRVSPLLLLCFFNVLSFCKPKWSAVNIFYWHCVAIFSYHFAVVRVRNFIKSHMCALRIRNKYLKKVSRSDTAHSSKEADLLVYPFKTWHFLYDAH